jgi:glycosyltransferase involved in cell wall biosynthesis
MRVAIEAASLSLSSGGLARYTKDLSLALARTFPADDFALISDQPFPLPEGAPPNLRRGGGPRNAAERRWWLWGIEREMHRIQAQLIHGPDFSVPYLNRRPSVMTLHDLSPWMKRGWHHAAGRVRQRTPLLVEFGVATLVITPGEAVRKQALERFRLRPDRVIAIPEAAASWFRPTPAAAPVPSYFLYVGTIEPRKNLPVLLEAWREVRKEHAVELWIAGRKRADAPALPEEPGIRYLGEVPDRDLPLLYSGALAFVYPSSYEGFGLPVLEAMQCGAAVIASRAVAEVAGDAAEVAEGPREFAAAMRQAASRPDWTAGRRQASLLRAGCFSWEQTARQTREVYDEAIRRFDR